METKSIYKIVTVCLFTFVVQLTIMYSPVVENNDTAEYNPSEKVSNQIASIDELEDSK